MQRFYGLHIDDVGSSRLSWPRLGRLMRQLPMNSALARAHSGGEPWTVADYLLRGVLAALGGPVVESPTERAESTAKHAGLVKQLAELHAESEERRASLGGD